MFSNLLMSAKTTLNHVLPEGLKLSTRVYVLCGDWDGPRTDIPWYPVRPVLNFRRNETYERRQLAVIPPGVPVAVSGEQGGSFQVYLCEVL